MKPVETFKVADLACDPGNIRVHSSVNIEAIRNSLKRFGQQRPILVSPDGKTVVAGNGTLTAARDLGWPTIDGIRTGLSGIELRAYAGADNRTAELAEWDDMGLGKLLVAMENDPGAPNPEDLGFSREQADAIMDRLKDGSTLKPLDIKPQPAMSWALIGIPTVRFGDISSALEAMSKLPDVVVETTVASKKETA